jgi:hypothetical protein
MDVESNTIAGNDFGDIGNKTINSIFDDPDSESDITPMLNGELAYTFAGTRTQLFLGNRLEDFIRFDFAAQLGVRQELPDKSILAAGYVFNAIPTEVWADPYVANAKRSETDRTASGVRLTYDKILGTNWQIEATYRDIEVDDELSGLTQLGLAPAAARLLDREGDMWQMEFLYLFKLAGGKQLLAPSFKYTAYDLDGDAMSNDRYTFQITHFYTGKQFDFATNLTYTLADYDKRNPIYRKTREDDLYGGSFSAFYKRFLNIDKMSLVGTVGAYMGDSNIDFYNSQVLMTSLSVLYRF